MAPGKWQRCWIYSDFANCCVERRQTDKDSVYSEY